MTIRFNFCWSVPPEVLRSFLTCKVIMMIKSRSACLGSLETSSASSFSAKGFARYHKQVFFSPVLGKLGFMIYRYHPPAIFFFVNLFMGCISILGKGMFLSPMRAFSITFAVTYLHCRVCCNSHIARNYSDLQAFSI